MTWSFEENRLSIGQKLITAVGPIKTAVECAGVIVVLVHQDFSGAAEDRNVFGFDGQTGTEQWQIPRQTWNEDRWNPATGLWLEDGKVWLYFWGGLDGFVDVRTGQVTIPPGQRAW
jgi:hypothetical protein